MAELIAVASGKGGVGKTWLAVTLGQALVRRGRRVLLFDGDLGLANIDVQLGIAPEVDLGTILGGRAALDAAVFQHAPSGLDVICGRSGSGRLADLADARARSFLEELEALKAAYDHVLLDLPAGLDGFVRQALVRSDRRLIVTTDEPTALTDAYALIKVSAGDGARGDLMVAINLAADHAAGAATFDGFARVCERFLKRRPVLAGVIRSDSRVRQAIRHQTPFLTRHPTAPAAGDVEAMAERLMGRA